MNTIFLKRFGEGSSAKYMQLHANLGIPVQGKVVAINYCLLYGVCYSSLVVLLF